MILIQNYNLEEILELFKVPYNFGEEELKNSYKMYLMTHPDKSGLDKNVFLFFLRFSCGNTFHQNLFNPHAENTLGCVKNAVNVLAAALVGLLVVTSFTAAMIYASIVFLENVVKVPLRVASAVESQGLDHSTHFGRAYTELQTTIFQYTTKSGEKASMEMRVRAGDAAKFALALSEVMDAEQMHMM